MASRSYIQRARAEDAERTRSRIIEAVFERLRTAPAEPIAIDRIAASAGVARSTVYAIFGSRAGLFDAVGRELAARSGYERLLDAKHQPDARGHLRAGFRASTEMLAANRDVYRALEDHSLSLDHLAWVPASARVIADPGAVLGVLHTARPVRLYAAGLEADPPPFDYIIYAPGTWEPISSTLQSLSIPCREAGAWLVRCPLQPRP